MSVYVCVCVCVYEWDRSVGDAWKKKEEENKKVVGRILAVASSKQERTVLGSSRNDYP